MFFCPSKPHAQINVLSPGWAGSQTALFKAEVSSYLGSAQSSGLANQKLTSGRLCSFVFQQINETFFLSYNLNRIIKYFPLWKERFCICILRIGRESLYDSVRSLLTNHAVLFFKSTGSSCASPALSPPGSTEEGRTLAALLLEHKEDLIRCVTQLRPIMEFLETAKEGFLTGTERRVTMSRVSPSLLNSHSTFF